MGTVKIWEEERIIPTYDIGEADKNPMFLEGRVYQGSSGKIYPYSTVETISDVKLISNGEENGIIFDPSRKDKGKRRGALHRFDG